MLCPVCASPQRDTRIIAGLTIHRCRECGLRTSPVVERKGTSYSDVDTAAYANSIGRVRQAQGEEVVSFARKHGANGEWLDVGCGYGYVLDAARAAGFRVRGIEPDAMAASAANARGIDVHHGQLEETTPPADVLSTLDVIEHLDDLNAFAALVKSKCRLWVIKVPSSDGMFFRIAHALRIRGAVERLWQTQYRHPHVVYFNERALGRFLRNHGCEVLATRYLQEVPMRTALSRLTLARDMPRWKAWLALVPILAINLIERLRRKSDALLVIARVTS
ncbi:MAG TPA: class I SAM-dependent methyltransferase [Thermoanaerobaculia bacterium]|nr:class I SAM-dependent methyltransferase [Thermoanaerobaculia bacterium]